MDKWIHLQHERWPSHLPADIFIVFEHKKLEIPSEVDEVAAINLL